MHVVSGAVPEVPRPEDHRPLTPEDLSADQLRVLRAAKAVFTEIAGTQALGPGWVNFAVHDVLGKMDEMLMQSG